MPKSKIGSQCNRCLSWIESPYHAETNKDENIQDNKPLVRITPSRSESYNAPGILIPPNWLKDRFLAKMVLKFRIHLPGFLCL